MRKPYILTFLALSLINVLHAGNYDIPECKVPVCCPEKTGYLFAYGGGSFFSDVFNDVFSFIEDTGGDDDYEYENERRFNGRTTTTTNGGFSIETGHGFIFGGGIGFKRCGFRVELEGQYTQLPGNNLLANIPIAPFGAVPGVNPLDGHLSSTATFINLLKEVHFDSAPCMTGYFGGGVGYANVDLDLNIVGGPSLSDSDSTFAAQFIVGADYDLCDNLAVFLQYKAVFLDETEYVLNGETSVLNGFWTDNMVGGLRFAF